MLPTSHCRMPAGSWRAQASLDTPRAHRARGSPRSRRGSPLRCHTRSADRRRPLRRPTAIATPCAKCERPRSRAMRSMPDLRPSPRARCCSPLHPSIPFAARRFAANPRRRTTRVAARSLRAREATPAAAASPTTRAGASGAAAAQTPSDLRARCRGVSRYEDHATNGAGLLGSTRPQRDPVGPAHLDQSIDRRQRPRKSTHRRAHCAAELP